MHFKFLTQITKSKAIQPKNSNLNHSIPRFEKGKEKNKHRNFIDYGYTTKNPKININETFYPILI